MKNLIRGRLILRWAAAASVCTFLLWIPLGAFGGSIRSAAGLTSAQPAMLLYVLYSPILAPLILCVTAPAYAAAFWLWGRASRRHSWIDSRWTAILGVSGAASLVPAVALAALCARGPSGVPFGEFLSWLPSCVAIFWGAIALPRWLLDSRDLYVLEKVAEEWTIKQRVNIWVS